MSTQQQIFETDSLFIGGEWVEPAGTGRINVVSPSTEEHVGSVPEAGPADVDAAAAAARRAFDAPTGWASSEPTRQADVLDALADAYESPAGEFAHRVSLQAGMPIGISSQPEAGFPLAVYR